MIFLTLKERLKNLEESMAELKRFSSIESLPLALSVEETAKALGISESAVYWMVYRNEIPHRRVNARGKKGQGKILIPRTAIIRWLEGEEVANCGG